MTPYREKTPPQQDIIHEPKAHLKRAPTLYLIIVFKIIKGTLFFMLAMGLYWESSRDLPRVYREFLAQPFVQSLFAHLRIHPENKFFAHLAEQIGDLTESKVRLAAFGTAFWSLFPLVEGIGMVYRVGWAGWMAIGESAFFVPIELYELARKFSWYMAIVMIINIFIVCYLYWYRDVLFKHHLPRHRHLHRPGASTV
jgi:uncharacterized membrane protein (DUF2068 family)